MRKSAEFTDGIPTLGGAAWIDLLNSRLIADAEPIDFLATDEDFLRWAVATGIEAPRDVTRERRALVLLREALQSAFDALAEGKPVPEASIAAVNRLLTGRAARQRIASTTSGYALTEEASVSGPQIATALAHEFAIFLTRCEAERLKRCESPACAMRFYDQGKNNRRRWCSTSVCGNRDKVARYRARQAKGQKPQPAPVDRDVI